MRQVGAYPVALMHGSFGTRQLVETAEQVERFRLVPKLTTDSISVIKHFVRAGLGVSLLPPFAVPQEIDAGQRVAIPVDHAVLGGAEAHIVTRRGRKLPVASNQLLLQLTSTMRVFEGGAAAAAAVSDGPSRPVAAAATGLDPSDRPRDGCFSSPPSRARPRRMPSPSARAATG